MYQIVYASTANKDADGIELIQQILKKSRENNTKKNITGILLYRSGIFIQLLEGDSGNVLDLYEKIKFDKRHTNVTTISTISDGQRIFPLWDMAYREIDDSFDLTIINEILRWNNNLSRTKKVTNQQVIKMLSFFREQIDGVVIADPEESF